MRTIVNFRGQFEFLSNFYPCTVMYEGMEYPSSEHAYQAAKTLDLELREEFLSKHDGQMKLDKRRETNPELNEEFKVLTAGQSKKAGQKLELRPDWDLVRISVMRTILEEKFAPGSELRAWLDETAPHTLVEGNTWGDTFWGQCPIGTGRNELGKLLMSIRDDIGARFV